MSEPAAAVPHLRLTLSHLRPLRLAASSTENPLQLQPVTFTDEYHGLLRRQLLAPAPPPASAFALPLERYAGVTVLRFGSTPLAVSGLTMPGEAPEGTGGGVSFRVSNDGRGGFFLNLLNAPVLGSASIGSVFDLSRSER